MHGSLVGSLHLNVRTCRGLEGADRRSFSRYRRPLPPTTPYKLSGRLRHAGDLWIFREFAGRVGNSDLAGDFQVDRGQKPQLITADLVSRKLDMKDLGGFIGADRGDAKTSPKPPPADRVLPQEPFSLESSRANERQVPRRASRHRKLRREGTATIKVQDGVRSRAANFVAGGKVVSNPMDARQALIKRTRISPSSTQARAAFSELPLTARTRAPLRTSKSADGRQSARRCWPEPTATWRSHGRSSVSELMVGHKSRRATCFPCFAAIRSPYVMSPPKGKDSFKAETLGSTRASRCDG